MEQINNTYEQFGVHLMIDAYGATEESLKDKNRLKELLHMIPVNMGMHTICDPVVVEVGPKNRKDPGGVSGFVMIAESHISFHTFPNRGFITIDVYTCQNELDTEKLVALFQNEFSFKSVETYIQKRGIRYPSSNIY